ncbi:nucleotide pyrophosphatase [Halobacteriales archaeon QS_1_67_19]|nr:MAG: nucleotide pyrophosphatase [Halobacteriales archaeon QS_1_67_19]
MSHESKTVVVGFDALDFRHLDAFADSLPNFRALRSAGVEAPLRSTFPPWTGSAWPSMYTGTDPGHHGAFGFYHHTTDYPDEDELVARTHVDAPAIWNYLTDLGEPAVVLNVPVTHPAEPIEGVLVPGYLAHEDDAGHPAGIREELSAALDEEYRIYSRAETADDPDAKRAGYLDLVELRGRAAAYLLEAYDWRVAVVQVQKTDTVFHNFDDPETFRQVYARADEALGRVLDAAGDANVVVCSDHGMGRVNGYTIYLNEVLRNAGFAETTTDAERPSLMDQKPELTGDAATDGDAGSSVAGRAVAAATAALGRAGVSPGDAYAVAERLGVGDLLVGALPDEAVSAAGEGVDWANSTAYTRSVELGVRVNLRGREPSGIVPPDEYEAVRDELIDTLSSLRTPDGEPAFEWVHRREVVYDGPHAEHACDVLFIPKDMNHVLSTSLVGRTFAPTDDYDHKRDGVFLAAGPAFEGAATPAELSLTDVAPTAMAAAGLDVPERMTGRVPADLLARPVSRTEYGEVPFGRDAGSSDDGAVEDRLRDLGYI